VAGPERLVDKFRVALIRMVKHLVLLVADGV